MPKYKNISKKPVSIMGVGEVEPLSTIETSVIINSAYLEEVKEEKKKAKAEKKSSDKK